MSTLNLPLASSDEASDQAIVVGELYMIARWSFLGCFSALVTHASARIMPAALTRCKSNSVEFKVESMPEALAVRAVRAVPTARKTMSVLCDRARSFLSASLHGTNHWTALKCKCKLKCGWPSSISLRTKPSLISAPLQVFTPYVWIRLGYAASNASDPSRQVVDIAQTLTYFLAIIPHDGQTWPSALCYRWRARGRRLYLDFLLSLAVAILALLVLHRLLRDPTLRLPSKRPGTSPECDLNGLVVDCRSYPVANYLSTRPGSQDFRRLCRNLNIKP